MLFGQPLLALRQGGTVYLLDRRESNRPNFGSGIATYSREDRFLHLSPGRDGVNEGGDPVTGLPISDPRCGRERVQTLAASGSPPCYTASRRQAGNPLLSKQSLQEDLNSTDIFTSDSIMLRIFYPEPFLFPTLLGLMAQYPAP